MACIKGVGAEDSLGEDLSGCAENIRTTVAEMRRAILQYGVYCMYFPCIRLAAAIFLCDSHLFVIQP